MPVTEITPSPLRRTFSDSTWAIDKTFEFCYGHRVHTQVLDDRFSDNLLCACRHLHGHEAKVQVFLEDTSLNPQGMVVDFRNTEWLKRFFNEHIDHQFIMDAHDPLLDHILNTALAAGGSITPEPVYLASANSADTDKMFIGYKALFNGMSQALAEMFNGLLIVDFVPTSEYLSRWVHSLVNFKMEPLGVRCSRVDWWETPKSRSSYSGSDYNYSSAPTFKII